MNIRPETIRSISLERKRQDSSVKPRKKPLGEWILLLLAYANKAMWAFTGMGKTPEERITQCAALSVAAMDEHFGSHTPLDDPWYDWQSGLFGVNGDGSLMYSKDTVIRCEGMRFNHVVRAQCGENGYVEFAPQPAEIDRDFGSIRTAVVFGRTTVAKEPSLNDVDDGTDNPRATMNAFVKFAKLNDGSVKDFEIHLQSSGEFNPKFFCNTLGGGMVRVTVEVLP